MVGSYECDHEPSGYMKAGNVLTAERLLASQQHLCCLQLVTLSAFIKSHKRGLPVSLRSPIYRNKRNNLLGV